MNRSLAVDPIRDSLKTFRMHGWISLFSLLSVMSAMALPPTHWLSTAMPMHEVVATTLVDAPSACSPTRSRARHASRA